MNLASSSNWETNRQSVFDSVAADYTSFTQFNSQPLSETHLELMIDEEVERELDIEGGSKLEPDDEEDPTDGDQADGHCIASGSDEMTPSLRYEAGVDATLAFDPLDARYVEKLRI